MTWHPTVYLVMTPASGSGSWTVMGSQSGGGIKTFCFTFPKHVNGPSEDYYFAAYYPGETYNGVTYAPRVSKAVKMYCYGDQG
jgi:hypothetical protein